jgi:8-oxo-dGTP diphosphatase
VSKWVPPVEGPLGMKAPERIRVVSGVAVVDRRKIFLAQRDPARSDFGYAWETPGGKVEPGEMSAHAMVREWDEELRLEVEMLEHLATFDFDPPVCRVPVRVAMYAVRLDPYEEPQRRQVLGFGWFSLETALALPLTPSTHALLTAPVGRGLFE